MIIGTVPADLAVNHGVGSTDHFQEPAVMTMIHYCFHSHFIYLDKQSGEPTP